MDIEGRKDGTALKAFEQIQRKKALGEGYAEEEYKQATEDLYRELFAVDEQRRAQYP